MSTYSDIFSKVDGEVHNISINRWLILYEKATGIRNIIIND